MTNKNNVVPYAGVTSNLPQRVQEHKEKLHELSFTSKYNLNKLVYWKLEMLFLEKNKLKPVLDRKN